MREDVCMRGVCVCVCVKSVDFRLVFRGVVWIAFTFAVIVRRTSFLLQDLALKFEFLV